MKTSVKVCAILLALTGFITFFISIAACESGAITAGQCMWRGVCSLLMIFCAILEGFIGILMNDNEELIEENKVLETKNIALLNRLPKVDNEEERDYKNYIHTPIHEKEYDILPCNTSECLHNDNGYCVNEDVKFNDENMCISAMFERDKSK